MLRRVVSRANGELIVGLLFIVLYVVFWVLGCIIWLQDYNSLPEPAPRELPKNEDPNMVRRNKRMLGQLLVGTLEVKESLCIMMYLQSLEIRTMWFLFHLFFITPRRSLVFNFCLPSVSLNMSTNLPLGYRFNELVKCSMLTLWTYFNFKGYWRWHVVGLLLFYLS